MNIMANNMMKLSFLLRSIDFNRQIFTPNLDGNPGIIEFPGIGKLQPVPLGSWSGVPEVFSNPMSYPHFTIHMTNIFCELVVDEEHWVEYWGEEFLLKSDESRINNIMVAVKGLLVLLRLRGFSQFIVPMFLEGTTMQELNQQPKGSIHLHLLDQEHIPNPLDQPIKAKQIMTESDLNWIRENLRAIFDLLWMEDFTQVLDIYSLLYTPTNPRYTISGIWSAVESLTKAKQNPKNKTGIRHSLRCRCAMLLGVSSHEKWRYYEDIGGLYDLRSSAVHGKPVFEGKTIGNEKDVQTMLGLNSSLKILNSLIVKVIEKRELFKEDELVDLQASFESEFRDNFN